MLTPINCIITYATNLANHITHPDDARKVTCILRTAQILSNYTRDLLDRALIDIQAFRPRLASALVSEVVQDAIDMITN